MTSRRARNVIELHHPVRIDRAAVSARLVCLGLGCDGPSLVSRQIGSRLFSSVPRVIYHDTTTHTLIVGLDIFDVLQQVMLATPRHAAVSRFTFVLGQRRKAFGQRTSGRGGPHCSGSFHLIQAQRASASGSSVHSSLGSSTHSQLGPRSNGASVQSGFTFGNPLGGSMPS